MGEPASSRFAPFFARPCGLSRHGTLRAGCSWQGGARCRSPLGQPREHSAARRRTGRCQTDAMRRLRWWEFRRRREVAELLEEARRTVMYVDQALIDHVVTLVAHDLSATLGWDRPKAEAL